MEEKGETKGREKADKTVSLIVMSNCQQGFIPSRI